jgi:hypothetical protein
MAKYIKLNDSCFADKDEIVSVARNESKILVLFKNGNVNTWNEIDDDDAKTVLADIYKQLTGEEFD